MKSEDEKRDEMARKFITVAANNSYTSIKNVWLILFTAGTFAALTQLDSALRSLNLVDGHLSDTHVTNPMISIFLFVIYFLTFFRFYVGDTRIFDVRYGETLKIFNENISQHDHSRETEEKYLTFLKYQDQDKFKFEAIFLIFQTLLIVYLSYQILNPVSFMKSYLILMIVNSIWLTISNLKFKSEIAEYVAEIFPRMENNISFTAMFPQKPGWIWIINNVVTATFLGAMLILLYYSHSWFEGMSINTRIILIVATLVMMANCVIDIHKARDFYFPRFSKFYSEQSIHLNSTVKPIQENPTTNTHKRS